MIECVEVSVNFDGKQVLDKFDYRFEDNTITAIMGESGRGKTTLIRCICGLHQLGLKEGTVWYHHDGNCDQIKKPDSRIFMMHQHYSNFPWKNCFENVMFPLELKGLANESTAIEAGRLLNAVGLGDHMTKYPSELSGGMNQRLAFARTLIMKPKVLLMDEPMSALDEKTRIIMQDLLVKMHKETKNTIIMVTHSREEAMRVADKIITL